MRSMCFVSNKFCWYSIFLVLIIHGIETYALHCCDIANIEATSNNNDKLFGLSQSRSIANASNLAQCPNGFQCVTCSVAQYSIEALVSECKDCKDEPMGGVCLPCLLGDYCPEGTMNENAHSLGALCPDGKVCTPSGLGYQISEGVYYTRYDLGTCPEGRLCPAGSFQSDLALNCQDLVVDYLSEVLDESLSETDPSGFYCKEGSSGYESLVEVPSRMLQECKKGFYCPSASTSVICPSGKFCKALTDRPHTCPGSNTCFGEGSSKPEPFLLRTVYLLLLYVVLMCLAAYANASLKRKYQAERNKQKKEMQLKDTKNVFTKQVLHNMGVDLVGSSELFENARQPLSFKLENLSFEAHGKILLSGMHGYFHHSRLTAIMGPLGCGKTTLLNTLCGRGPSGKLTGELLTNGVKRGASKIQTVLGFVPQDDTIFADMTIYENLYYSAHLRLPSSYSVPRRLEIVAGVLEEMLDLGFMQHSVVGRPEKGGISGGQRKLVSIGLELVADPTALFLDEPTSGLAAADTLSIMQSFHKFSHAQRTVIAVVHQPRFLAFMLFHDVVLMYPGGFTAYFGPADQAEKYFESMGYFTPKVENPADFFLDVISGTVEIGMKGTKASDLPTAWRDNVETRFLNAGGVRAYLQKRKKMTATLVSNPSHENARILSLVASKWRRVSNQPLEKTRYHNPLCHLATEKIDRGFSRLAEGSEEVPKEQLKDYFVDMGCELARVDEVLNEIDSDNNGSISKEEFIAMFELQLKQLDSEQKLKTASAIARESKEKIMRRAVPSLPSQVYYIAQRACMRKMRRYSEMMVNLTMLMGCGLVVGILLSSDHQAFNPEDPKLPLMMTLLLTITATLSAVSSLNVFGNTKVLTIRERAAGISTLAFFLANVAVDLVENVWQPLFFLGICYNWVLPESPFQSMYWALILTSFAASGVGILISILIRQESMTMAAVLAVLVTSIFVNGTVGVYYTSVKENSMEWLWMISFARWAQELLFVNELKASADKPYQDLLIQGTIQYYGFFPATETVESWREGKSDRQQQNEWNDYLESYQMECVLALLVIGSILRAVAFFFMQYLKEIAEYTRFFKLIIKTFIQRKVVPFVQKRVDSCTTICGCYTPMEIPEETVDELSEVKIQLEVEG
mmetsp:Transcript_30646/g.42435  ORF Transcript_30646/g.42435 Transcript_30646/m.42435 type:complete len:1138 (+) Transcript_30646:17-3430(+)